jgi:hypothetical protein
MTILPVTNQEQAKEKERTENSQLIMNRYASPGGGASMKVQETMYCVNRPAKGVLNGILLAKNEVYGRMPSRPSS